MAAAVAAAVAAVAADVAPVVQRANHPLIFLIIVRTEPFIVEHRVRISHFRHWISHSCVRHCIIRSASELQRVRRMNAAASALPPFAATVLCNQTTRLNAEIGASPTWRIVIARALGHRAGQATAQLAPRHGS